jgi:hypothetical protein
MRNRSFQCQKPIFSFCDLVTRNTGFVAQIGLKPSCPLPQTDLASVQGTRYTKSCEAVEDRGTDLDLRNLAVEVARRETLTE